MDCSFTSPGSSFRLAFLLSPVSTGFAARFPSFPTSEWNRNSQSSDYLLSSQLTSIVQMPVPDLPLDLIYVVSCHLAGLFAFGTLASLRLTNHAVAETVLPVLYETVLVDHMQRMPSTKDGEDERQKDALRRYTK